jgi:hypothetical protein
MRGRRVSSAFLYLAIIAIWAGVLIPRWLKRDSSRAKAAKSSQSESPEARQSPDELTDDEPVEINAGADAGGAGIQMADDNTQAETGPSRAADPERASDPDRAAGRDRAAGKGQAAGRDRAADRGRVAGANRVASASGVGAADEAELSGYEAGEAAGLRPADPQTRRRVLSARRRMLMMLIVLAAAAAGIALIGMAAWWVAIPPVAMLGGYLLVLREVRHADAERALIRADAEQLAEHRAEQRRRREAQEAAARQREEAQTARVIDISERVRDELYDQYAEGERRAVGD